MNLCKDPELMPEPDDVAKALREPLLKVFPAALLGRLVVIPYYPLSEVMLRSIIRLQLGRIQKRVQANHGVPFTYGDDVVQLVLSRCNEVESGGRVIDAILTNTVLPKISREYLTRLSEGPVDPARRARRGGGRVLVRLRLRRPAARDFGRLPLPRPLTKVDDAPIATPRPCRNPFASRRRPSRPPTCCSNRSAAPRRSAR